MNEDMIRQALRAVFLLGLTGGCIIGAILYRLVAVLA